MKKLAVLGLVATVSLFASEAKEFSGVLTTPACAAQGAFADCYLENYACGSDGCFKTSEVGTVDKNAKYALFDHSTGKTYVIDASNIKISQMSGGMNKNGVVVTGVLDEATGVIKASEFKAPPPPKKSFFKGCL